MGWGGAGVESQSLVGTSVERGTEACGLAAGIGLSPLVSLVQGCMYMYTILYTCGADIKDFPLWYCSDPFLNTNYLAV